MNFYFFDGQTLKTMLTGAANLLAATRAEIDALNVFPVPDGDTGTNMYLTLLHGVREMQKVESSSLGVVAAAAAKGCLLGARGNSGVILSQIIQGFADDLATSQKAGAADLIRTFATGTDYAYRAVTNPVEGTMLTVCRAISQAMSEAEVRVRDLLRITVYACRQAQRALELTPELLPALKQAGVVDAGGKGLVIIMEGIVQALKDVAAKKDIKLFDLAASQQKQYASISRTACWHRIRILYRVCAGGSNNSLANTKIRTVSIRGLPPRSGERKNSQSTYSF